VPGAIMGTLLYSSPEQLTGGTATQASDQFSFCVALHKAIEGVAPFPGGTANELLAEIRNKPPVIAKDRAVPTWARALVRRGLSPDPGERHPSMDAVLRQLKRARGWKRWRMPVIVAALVATAGFTSFSLRGDASSVVPCDGGEVVWDPATRLATSMAIEKVGTPYAHEVDDHVMQMMDHQATALSEAHRGACLAHRGGASSDPMFDREASCLAQKIGEFKSVIGVLAQTTTSSLSGASDVAAGLHHPRACLDVSHLSSNSVPPSELRSQVATLMRDLATATALRHAGRLTEAETSISTTIKEANAIGYQPVVAETQLELGRILIGEYAFERAISVLRNAMQTALANNLPSLAVEAVARRIWAEGQVAPDLNRVARDLDFADALSRSVVGDHFARALLLNNVGAIYATAQQPDEAMRFYQRARDAVTQDANPDIELSVIDLNIGLASRDAVERRRALSSVVSRRTALLGEHHPQTLSARFYAASYDDDPRRAFSELNTLCAELRSFSKSLYVGCERELAVISEHVGANETRLKALTSVVDAGVGDPEIENWAQLSAAELSLENGDRRNASDRFAKSVSAGARASTWWDRANVAEANIYLAIMTAAQGDRARAKPLAREALDVFLGIQRVDFRLSYRLRVEQAQSLLRD
jgi:tetratricopeptide (TPR) repeat protein